MNIGRSARRAFTFVVHNWPLKLAAIAVATLLYAGLVVSQDSNVYPGPIRVDLANQPLDTVVTNDLRDVEQIRYIAPADLGRLTADDFRATVDPSSVTVTGPSAAVNRVVAARASALIDGSGIDVDREVEVDAIDAAGEIVSGVESEARARPARPPA